jgi:multidrug efflux system outer membrane protein
VSSFLEVLDTDRQLFDAQRDLVVARRDESVAVVQLYKALGGGWQAEAPAAAAAPPPAGTAVMAAVPRR